MNTTLPSLHHEAPLSPVGALNRDCFCLTLDPDALALALESETGSEVGQPDLAELIRQRCPYLFAAQPVFVAQAQLERMAQVVQAVESVVALPAYREQVLSAAPAIARRGTRGPLWPARRTP